MAVDRKLSVEDILDLRAYERERQEFRSQVMALKRRRRVHLGSIITLVFENRDTVRFQIQEMARAERILTDEGIAVEVGIYNPLIPEPGQLSATLFLELTSDEQLREWLPKLVGIERSIVVRLDDGDEIRCIPEEGHEATLTRDEVTASVHYIRFELTDAQVEAFGAGATLAVDHPEYRAETRLSADTVAELLTDLRP